MQPSNLCTDHVDNRSDFLAEQREYLFNRSYNYPVRPRSVAESYCQDNRVMAFHVTGRRLNGERYDLSAICQIAVIPFDCSAESVGQSELQFKVPALLPVDGYIQKPVLVSIVKVAQDSEEGREEMVRSIVRLYRLDNCPHCLAQGLNVPRLLGKPTGIIGNGELQDALIRRRVDAGLVDGDGVNQVIESRSQVVNTIPADHRPAVAVQPTVKMNVEMVMMTLSISVRGDRVRLGILPSEDFFGDGFGMFLCTPDLQPTVC
jgi:hypothetical protein